MSADRRAGRVERQPAETTVGSGFGSGKANDSYRSYERVSGPRRLSRARLLAIGTELSERDRFVLVDLRRVRVLSGAQLERLHFAAIVSGSQGRLRRRVLQRLVEFGLVTTLERRVGGVRAGSAGLVYVLTAGGRRLLDEEMGVDRSRYRMPTTPGRLFLEHSLAISETYVALVETSRRDGAMLVDFRAEAEAWWPAVRRPELKPDALVVLAQGDFEDVWWLEVDRSTESLPRLRAKLECYLNFAGSGLSGPLGVIPRVMVSVPDERRRVAVVDLLGQLPDPMGLLQVALAEEAAVLLMRQLRSDEPERAP